MSSATIPATGAHAPVSALASLIRRDVDVTRPGSGSYPTGPAGSSHTNGVRPD
jgi:hypothetical protein